MEDLIAELKGRKANGTLCADDPLVGGCAAPLRQSEIESAEAILGFKIPVLLRRIYAEVANGGFGYAYGLLGLRGGPRNEDGLDSVGLYQTFRELDPENPAWHWPHGLLPIGHLGCAMFHFPSARGCQMPKPRTRLATELVVELQHVTRHAR
ncbi:SMI1/KNR4 family protein [Xanthomonas hyacinthi]|nr:SMI1/KNR4 family protein [Xanthomonas hyacinthi]QGY77431.1 SMI1/KNR4 family protein [Xanthomonas hyacinthi]